MMNKLPYYIEHALVSVSISIPFALFGVWDWGLIAGMFFYIGREVRDVEKLHNWNMEGFDWKGLLAPLLSNFVLIASNHLWN